MIYMYVLKKPLACSFGCKNSLDSKTAEVRAKKLNFAVYASDSNGA